MIRDATKAEQKSIDNRKTMIKLCWVDKGIHRSLISNPRFTALAPGTSGVEYSTGKVTTEEVKRNGLYFFANMEDAQEQIDIFHESGKEYLRPYAVLEVIPLGRRLRYRDTINYPRAFTKRIIKVVKK